MQYYCTFEFELRHLPGDDPDEVIADVERHAAALSPGVQRVHQATGIRFERLSGLGGFETVVDHPVVRLARACVGSGDPVAKVSFGSEAALFDQAGIPTVLCGPGHITEAHQPDEWIGLDQLARCEAFMARLAGALAVR